MFSGLIEEIGLVAGLEAGSGGKLLTIECSKVIEDASIGDSIAVDGACLTVEEIGKNSFSAVVSGETLEKTTLGSFRKGRSVNLEAALKASGRIGGHIEQGHVEGVGEVRELRRGPVGTRLSVLLPEETARGCVVKGSIALDGISLTIAALANNTVEAAVIPGTLERTTMKEWRAGRKVNVETDVIGRYVLTYLDRMRKETGNLTMESLKDMGF